MDSDQHSNICTPLMSSMMSRRVDEMGMKEHMSHLLASDMQRSKTFGKIRSRVRTGCSTSRKDCEVFNLGREVGIQRRLRRRGEIDPRKECAKVHYRQSTPLLGKKYDTNLFDGSESGSVV